MAGDINFKLRYIVPLHPGIPRAHTVRKLGPEIPSELALITHRTLPHFTSGNILNFATLSLARAKANTIVRI